jgi:hypothetical protein
MTGPDEGGPASRGHLRAAQADREQTITVLKAAYAQGRLTKDELEARAGQAFASRTYAELATLTADLPADSPAARSAAARSAAAGSAAAGSAAAGSAAAGSAAAGSAAGGPPPGTPGRTMAKAVGRTGICLLVAVALAEGAFLSGNFLLIVAACFALIAASGFFGYGILDAWQQRRFRGQLPPGSGQRRRGSEGRLPGDDAARTRISPSRADRTRADSRTWPTRAHWTRTDSRADRTRADSRADRTRADSRTWRTRPDSRAWRPGWDRGRPSRRGAPVPVGSLCVAVCDSGYAP